MNELWSVALPILVIDIANPILFAAVILSLATDRPYGNSLALLAGHTLAYLVAGAFLLFGLGQFLADWSAPLIERYQNPSASDFIVGLVVGLALLWAAFRWKSSPPDPSGEPPRPSRGGLGAAFMFGAAINFMGIPFALPYFAFISYLMKLETGELLPLVIYNLGYVVPFLLMPLALRLIGPAVMPLLDRISAWVGRASAHVIPTLLGLLGLVLVADATLFFATGTGLL